MVYIRSSISTCKSFDRQPLNMASPPLSLTETKHNHHQQQQQLQRNRKQQPTSPKPFCDRSRFAAVDVVILIAVIGACGFLFYPSVKMFCLGIVEIGGMTISIVQCEIFKAPMVYASLGLSLFFAIMATWGISKCISRKCGNPTCRGLHKAAEFDIQIETEECLKNSTTSSLLKDGGGRGLFELSLDHHRELEAELKKIAPPNGRAILVFRARCGCSVGTLEVPGPKKLRKIKK